MNNTEFVTLVAEMRAAQKAYFRDRTQGALQESKRLEQGVDLYLKRYSEPKAEPSLFDKMR